MNEVIPQFGERQPGVDYEFRPGSYLVLRNRLGEVAVFQTPSGRFLPGGGQDEGETPEETAEREAFEEAGFRVRIKNLIGTADEFVYSCHEERHFWKRCVFFNAEFVSREGPGTPDYETLWLSPGEAAEQLKHESQRWAVRNSYA